MTSITQGRSLLSSITSNPSTSKALLALIWSEGLLALVLVLALELLLPCGWSEKLELLEEGVAEPVAEDEEDDEVTAVAEPSDPALADDEEEELEEEADAAAEGVEAAPAPAAACADADGVGSCPTAERYIFLRWGWAAMMVSTRVCAILQRCDVG